MHCLPVGHTHLSWGLSLDSRPGRICEFASLVLALIQWLLLCMGPQKEGKLYKSTHIQTCINLVYALIKLCIVNMRHTFIRASCIIWGFSGGSVSKESASSAGGLIPGLGRSPREGSSLATYLSVELKVPTFSLSHDLINHGQTIWPISQPIPASKEYVGTMKGKVNIEKFPRGGDACLFQNEMIAPNLLGQHED